TRTTYPPALHALPTRRSSDLGTPVPSSALATSEMAVICGTPTPATIRVVQIDPGPMPTLTASTPASTSASAASAVALLPPTTWRSEEPTSELQSRENVVCPTP